MSKIKNEQQEELQGGSDGKAKLNQTANSKSVLLLAFSPYRQNINTSNANKRYSPLQFNREEERRNIPRNPNKKQNLQSQWIKDKDEMDYQMRLQKLNIPPFDKKDDFYPSNNETPQFSFDQILKDSPKASKIQSGALPKLKRKIDQRKRSSTHNISLNQNQSESDLPQKKKAAEPIDNSANQIYYNYLQNDDYLQPKRSYIGSDEQSSYKMRSYTQGNEKSMISKTGLNQEFLQKQQQDMQQGLSHNYYHQLKAQPIRYFQPEIPVEKFADHYDAYRPFHETNLSKNQIKKNIASFNQKIAPAVEDADQDQKRRGGIQIKVSQADNSNQQKQEAIQIKPDPFNQQMKKKLQWSEIKLDKDKHLDGRSNHSAVYYQDHLYLYGGRDIAQGYDQSLVAINTSNYQWFEVNFHDDSIRPGKLIQHSAIIANGEMVLFGGIDGGLTNCQNLWIFNFFSSKWRKPIINQQQVNPPPMDSHSANYYAKSESMFVFGGFHGDQFSCSNLLFQYSIKQNQWTKHTNENQLNPEPRFSHAASIVGDHLYVYGGMGKVNRYCDLWKLNLGTKKWKQIQYKGDFPERRSGMGCDVMGNWMVIFGGISSYLFEKNDLFAFDTITEEWICLHPGTISPKMLNESEKLVHFIDIIKSDYSSNQYGNMKFKRIGNGKQKTSILPSNSQRQLSDQRSIKQTNTDQSDDMLLRSSGYKSSSLGKNDSVGLENAQKGSQKSNQLDLLRLESSFSSDGNSNEGSSPGQIKQLGRFDASHKVLVDQNSSKGSINYDSMIQEGIENMERKIYKKKKAAIFTQHEKSQHSLSDDVKEDNQNSIIEHMIQRQIKYQSGDAALQEKYRKNFQKKKQLLLKEFEVSEFEQRQLLEDNLNLQHMKMTIMRLQPTFVHTQKVQQVIEIAQYFDQYQYENGQITNQVPTPRDGHSMIITNNKKIIVFGGDRNSFTFNDIYEFWIEKEQNNNLLEAIKSHRQSIATGNASRNSNPSLQK